MKLVIKIPEDVYTRLFDNGIQDNEISVDDVCEMARALRLGTPIPKSHGRLIDADLLKQKALCQDYLFENIANVADIDSAPTIIEADTESEDKERND